MTLLHQLIAEVSEESREHLRVLNENIRMKAVVDAARLMPRETPDAGGASTEHDFKIPAHAVWALDKALLHLDFPNQQ